MRVRLFLVSEANQAYLNQVKLNLFSLRKNGGSLSSVPVTLVTNNKSFSDEQQQFLTHNFGPIDFKTMPKLGSTPHTSKFNAFYAVDPSEYDVLIFMDCDTVIIKPIDGILDQIRNGAELACRRGGETDRSSVVDLDDLISRRCSVVKPTKVMFNGELESPIFNTGVFVATSETVLKIRSDAILYSYDLFKKWQLGSRDEVSGGWTIDQVALSLACVNSDINVEYLPEIYNSWGNIEGLRILHCFKSLYRFNRNKMFHKPLWKIRYKKSEVYGKRLIVDMVEEYIETFKE